VENDLGLRVIWQ